MLHQIIKWVLIVALAPAAPAFAAETVIYDRTGQVELARFSVARPDEQAWRAPHFVRRVRSELALELCETSDASACPELASEGYHVISTLHWKMQTTAEKLLKAAVIAPHLASPEEMRDYLDALRVPQRKWLWRLRDYQVHNGAVAAMDYRTGHVLAYVGSADAQSPTATPAFQPGFDVLRFGWRQPGSTFKPFAYLPGILTGEMTAATLFMDVATEVAPGYWPRNVDGLERGPVRMREAIRFSINVPAVKAAAVNGIGNVKTLAGKFGLRFHPAARAPGPAIALGVLETHPIEMLGAYGVLANGGVRVPRTTLVKVTAANGDPVELRPRVGKPVIPPQEAFLMTSMLASTVDRKHNPYWGKFALQKDGENRPVALKTGTSNDARDLSAYGYLAPPGVKDQRLSAIVVGVWMGNNDNTSTGKISSLNTAAPLWHNFTAEVSAKWPIAGFTPPEGMVKVGIDAYSGKLPGPHTEKIVREWFIEGTLPGVDDTKMEAEIQAESGRLWQQGCRGSPESRVFLDPVKLIGGQGRWSQFNRDWIARAREGPGVAGGPWSSETTYFYDRDFNPYGATWGAPFLPTERCDIDVAARN